MLSGLIVRLNHLQSPASLSTLSGSTIMSTQPTMAEQEETPPAHPTQAENPDPPPAQQDENPPAALAPQGNNNQQNRQHPTQAQRTEAIHQEIKKEKDYVPFLKSPPREHFKNLNIYWGTVRHLDFCQLTELQARLDTKEVSKMEGIS